MKVKADKVRDEQAFKLMGMVEKAMANYNLETCLNTKELPLNNEITLDSCDDNGNLVVYAVTKFSVVTTKNERVKFLKLDRDDIYTLQDIIHDEYDIDIN